MSRSLRTLPGSCREEVGCGGGTRVHGGAGDVAHHTVEEREAHMEAAGEYGYDAMAGTMENDPYEGTHKEMSA